MKNVCIVIVNYNGGRYQNDAIASLFQMTEKDFDIVVVDNCSKDNSIDMVQSTYPSVIVLKQNENYGFAKGCNIGIEYSLSKGYCYTMLINNDIIADKFLLSELMNYAEENIVTVPKIYFYDNPQMLWCAGGKIAWKHLETINIGYREIDCGQYNQIKQVDFLNGCCALIFNRVFREVGKFDESYFMYFEDTDFGLRLQEAGKSIVYIPTAKLWHKVSSSTGGEDSQRQVYYMNRNRLYFAKKHKDTFRLSAYIYSTTKTIAKFLLSPIYKKNNRYIWKAYFDYFRGIMGKGDL